MEVASSEPVANRWEDAGSQDSNHHHIGARPGFRPQESSARGLDAGKPANGQGTPRGGGADRGIVARGYRAAAAASCVACATSCGFASGAPAPSFTAPSACGTAIGATTTGVT